MTTAPRRLVAGTLSAVVVLAPLAGSVLAAVAGLRTGMRALDHADPAGALLGVAALALAAVLAWATAAAAAGVVEAWSTAGVLPALTVGSDAGASVTSVTSRRGDGPRGRTGLVSAGVAALVVAALTAPGAAASTGPAGRPAVVAAQGVTSGSTAATTATGASTTPPTTASSTTTTTTAPRTTVTPAPGSPATASATGPAVPAASMAATRSVPDAPPGHLRAAGAGAPAAGAPAASVTAPRGSWSALAEDGFRAPRGSGVDSAALVTAPPVRTTTAAEAASEVVVLAGDSLWSVAARHLGPAADASEVAAAWPLWWEANRSVVGDDPDLLLPGQRLVAPAP